MQRKSIFAVFALIYILSNSCISQEQSKYAIFELECLAKDNEAKKLAANIEDLLFVNLSDSNAISLVERSRLNIILKELNLSLGWQTSPEESLRLGKLIGADVGLVGSIFDNDNQLLLVVKLVDLHTTIIKNITIIPVDKNNLLNSANFLTQFILHSDNSVKALKEKTFIGIGGFEDLSINNRYENIGFQVRSYVQQYFNGTPVTVLERSLVEPILNEQNLKRSGLVQNPESESSVLPTFVLIDGFYQSFREQQTKISMVLRIHKMGGSEKILTIESEPGKPLYQQIISAVQRTLKEGFDAKSAISREQEYMVQLNLGKERSRLIFINTSYPRLSDRLGGYLRSEENQKRIENIKEAIQAFENAIILDSKCYEAQLLLGVCLCDSNIADYKRGRECLLEVFAGSNDEKLRSIARFQLGKSYLVEGDNEKDKDKHIYLWETSYDILERLLEEIKNPEHRSWILGNMSDLDQKLSSSGKRTEQERLDFQKIRILNGCEEAIKRNSEGLPIWPYGFSRYYFNNTSQIFMADKIKTTNHYFNIVQDIRELYPSLLPYFIITYVIEQKTDPNRIEMLLKSMKEVRNNTKLVCDYNTYCRDSLQEVLGWAMSQNEFDLAILAGNMIIQALNNGMSIAKTDQDYITTCLGYAYMQKEEWNKALTLFEKKEGKEISMYAAGPWGEQNSIVVVNNLIKICKQNISGVITKNNKPMEYQINEPFLKIGNMGSFDIDKGTIWFASDKNLYSYIQAEKIQQKAEFNLNVKNEITCITISGENIWFGTDGDGLYDYNYISGNLHRYSEDDGLPLENITSLFYYPNKLWIGFGQRNKGAIGYIENQKFIGIMPKLNLSTESVPYYGTLESDAIDASPKHRISGLLQADPNNLWVAVNGKGLQHFIIGSEKWDTVNAANGFNREPAWAITDNENRVSCIVGRKDIIIVGSANESSGRSGYDYRIGGITIYYPLENKWKSINMSSGLPKQNIYSLFLDGNNLWAGGLGYIALIDLNLNRVTNIFRISNKYAPIKNIRTQDNKIFFAAGNDLYFLSKIEYNLN